MLRITWYPGTPLEQPEVQRSINDRKSTEKTTTLFLTSRLHFISDLRLRLTDLDYVDPSTHGFVRPATASRRLHAKAGSWPGSQ